MKYFKFNTIEIPLSCVQGLSYSKSGNLVPTSEGAVVCIGINVVQVQVQVVVNYATAGDDYIDLARKLSQIKPTKSMGPFQISVAGSIVLPELQFMLSSVNQTFQSDRLGMFQELQLNLTFQASRLTKKESRAIQLYTKLSNQIPKITLHCNGKSIECNLNISVVSLRLSGFKGSVQLLLADTYKDIPRDTWLVMLNNSDNAYVTIEGYGRYYILSTSLADNNYLSLELTKFSTKWYQNVTTTFMNHTTLKEIFKDAEVSSRASLEYFKCNDTLLNTLHTLQESLGFNIGLREDKIYLYDTPNEVPIGNVTYDYDVDSDVMTKPISGIILRDSLYEYFEGDRSGEVMLVNACCRVSESSCSNVLKYARFNQNMILLTIPRDERITIGSLVNINTGHQLINTVCTEFDIDFMRNLMTLELHYV